MKQEKEVFNVWLPDWSRRWIIEVDLSKEKAMDRFHNKAAELSEIQNYIWERAVSYNSIDAAV